MAATTKLLALRVPSKLYDKIRSVCERDDLMLSEACRSVLRQAFAETTPKERPKKERPKEKLTTKCNYCDKEYSSREWLLKHLEKVRAEKEEHPLIYRWHIKSGDISE